VDHLHRNLLLSPTVLPLIPSFIRVEKAQRVWTISGPAEVTPLCRGAKAAKVGRDRTTWRKLNARWR
jgi:hypothetical protein